MSPADATTTLTQGASVLDQELDALGKALEPRGDGQRLDGDVGSEGIPLEGIAKIAELGWKLWPATSCCRSVCAADSS